MKKENIISEITDIVSRHGWSRNDLVRAIDEFGQEIRQDQKEKCSRAIKEIKDGEWGIHPAHIITAIMEADQ